jgi:hypothetical protein
MKILPLMSKSKCRLLPQSSDRGLGVVVEYIQANKKNISGC